MPNIGLGLNIQCGAALSPFSAEYQAILNYARTNSYTLPSPTEQLFQNKLIVDLKTNGIWDKLDAFYMFANSVYNGATYAGSSFARINWKTPTANYGLGAPNLPSISAAAGFTGSSVGGSNQAVNLNLNASTATKFTSPNGSFGVFVGTVEPIANPIMATTSGGNRIRNGSSSVISGGSVTTTFSENSFIHLNKTLTTITVYRSGVALNGTNNAWVSDNASFCILYNGSSYGSSQVKAAFVGGDLSSTSPINIPTKFNDIISTYITNLNLISSFVTYAAMAKEMQYTILP